MEQLHSYGERDFWKQVSVRTSSQLRRIPRRTDNWRSPNFQLADKREGKKRKIAVQLPHSEASTQFSGGKVCCPSRGHSRYGGQGSMLDGLRSRCFRILQASVSRLGVSTAICAASLRVQRGLSTVPFTADGPLACWKCGRRWHIRSRLSSITSKVFWTEIFLDLF